MKFIPILAVSLAATVSAECYYPMWTMKDVGDGKKCDSDINPSGCPLRTTDCDHFATFIGESCTVVCADNVKGDSETRKCIGDSEWETVGEPLDCDA